MSKPTIELILHPVRQRILSAMSGGRTFTTSELCARMPEESKATMYRHVALLLEGELLEVDEERQVRGAVERRYRLRQERAAIGAEVGAEMSPEEHRLAFTASMAALLAEFDAYLGRDGARPFDDSVSYRQGTLWLDKEEAAEMLGEISDVFRARRTNGPSPRRTPYRGSMILFPAEQLRPQSASVQPDADQVKGKREPRKVEKRQRR
jgi:DNA-binding transcriptional ArsR family regulator